MKKLISLCSLVALAFILSYCSEEDEIFTPAKVNTEEVTSSSSLRIMSTEKERTTGYDAWGFNFVAHNFNSYLINAMLGDPAFQGMPHYRKPGLVYRGEGVDFWNALILEYPYFTQMMPAGLLDCKLEMKWNDALLNKEGIYPPTWDNTESWIVFKYKMHTETENWTHVRKLVSISNGDQLIDGIWYDAEGKEIGIKSYYWPNQLIIKQVINTGENLYVPAMMPPSYVCPNSVGFGNF